MSLKGNIGEILGPAVDLIYPPRCPLCGDAIAQQSGVCGECWTELIIPSQPNCAACQRPMQGKAVEEEMLCAPCIASPPIHDGIAAATLYNEASRKLVLAFKHGRRIALAKMLARQMAARLAGLEGEWLIVPVPLHRSRLWYRGFNQAALLAHEIAPLIKQRLLVDGLLRRKRTTTLGGLGKKARERALAGSISVNKSRSRTIENAEVILVDDVLTSGATSNACVAALKRSGARRVVISCYSRVLN